MNKSKFNLYNIRPVEKDWEYDALVEYITKNNITHLPKKLRNNQVLFKGLAIASYPKLFQMDFDNRVYEAVISEPGNYAYVMEDIFLSNKVHLAELPDTLKNSADYLNQILEMSTIEWMFLDILAYTKDKKELYDGLNKKLLTHRIVLGGDLYQTIDNPHLAADREVFKRIVDKYTDYEIPKLFNEEVYHSLTYEDFYRLLTASRISVLDIPFDLYEDAAFLLNVLLRFKPYNYDQVELIKKMYASGNEAILNVFYHLICDGIELPREVYHEIDKEALANYIVDNDVAHTETETISYDIRSDEEIFKKLIDKKYAHMLSIEFACYGLYSKYQEEIFELFKQYKVTPNLENPTKNRITEYFLNNICHNPDILEEDNLKILANYIALTRSRKVLGIVANSARLFNYLYNMDIDFLLEIPFTSDVYYEIPIENLQKYYRKHPQQIDCVDAWLALDIMNVAQDVDVNVIRPAILLDCRRQAAKEMKPYDGIAHEVCNRIIRYGSDREYEHDALLFEMVEMVLGVSQADIKSLLKKYEKNPADYEVELNNLLGKFYTTKKEQLALKYTDDRMHHIEAEYCKDDDRELKNNAKKQKRKLLYYEYLIKKIKNNNLTSSEAEIIKLISSIDKRISGDDQLDFLTGIIHGKLNLNIPDSYKKQNNLKNYRRLKHNYEPILNKIYLANPEYQAQIVGYFNGKTSHQELRRVIAERELKVLHEIRELYKACSADIVVDGNKLSFNIDDTLSAEEVALNKAYEEALITVKNIQKLINNEMNIAYPLEKITVSPEEVATFGTKKSKPRQVIDHKKLSLSRVMSIIDTMNTRDNIEDKKTKRMYQKLFIDSGLIYALSFLNGDYYDYAERIREDYEYLPILFEEEDMKLENLEKIMKRIRMYKYTTPADDAILGADISYKIASNEAFISGGRTDDKRKERVALAAKYTALAGRNIKSTIPFVTTETDGIRAERYMSNDPKLLVSGIDTDACFRIFGTDNDFMLYTIFNKNGFVMKLTDEIGRFVGRVSGFRNGNVLYLNQARTILDTNGVPNKASNDLIKRMRASIETNARAIVEATKDSEDPIDYVFILKAYGYGDCDYLPIVRKYFLPNSYPMNVDAPDYQEFLDDAEIVKTGAGTHGFLTDYTGTANILLLASRDGRNVEKNGDIIEYDPAPLYDRPRGKPKVYKGYEINQEVIERINNINARDIYWGDTSKRRTKKENFEPITKLPDIVAAVIAEDFYILIDRAGRLNELCLSYDERACKEFMEYHSVIMETYKNTIHKQR